VTAEHLVRVFVENEAF